MNKFLVTTALIFSQAQVALAKEVKFETAEIKVANKKVKVELAKSEEQRARGLMYRTELKDGEGMLFVFDSEEPQSFWMKNTFIPLSIGYFDKNKKLVSLQDMKPVKSEMETNLPTYPSGKPALYALEVPLGWFARNSIKLGAEFEFVKTESVKTGH